MSTLVPAAAPVSRHATAAPRGPAWTAMEEHVNSWPAQEASHVTSQAPVAALPVPALPLPVDAVVGEEVAGVVAVVVGEVGQYTFASSPQYQPDTEELLPVVAHVSETEAASSPRISMYPHVLYPYPVHATSRPWSGPGPCTTME